MTCSKCQEQMTFNFLDDEVKMLTATKIRVKHECPKCFLRVYSVLKEGAKA